MSEVFCRIVFVCTGNTCRSPLAQVLCEKLLSERLGCAVGDLPARGYLVESAGLAAFPGCQASAEALNIAKEFGTDLDRHQSRPFTLQLLTEANHIFAMTRGHLEMLEAICGDLGPKPRLLAESGEDIADPLSSDAEVYRACARQILSHLEKVVSDLVRSRSRGLIDSPLSERGFPC